VAFIGGSITEMDGYRPMVCNYLQEKFPQTEFSFTNAGISSTCSTNGAFRMERDVLGKGPLDLLFIEFAVNDDQDAAYSREEAILGMEAIIRKARRHNPNLDIVITYFVNPEILSDYQHGKERTSIASHDAVAQHYSISTCNLAKEVTDQITIGTLDWDTFGGTHPNEFGNAICKNMIVAMMEKAWTKKERFPIPIPVLPNNFENGKLIDPEKSNYNKMWFISVPDWDKLEGRIRPRFRKIPVLSTDKEGAEIIFKFTGTAVGAYILAGPDAGIVEVSIDSGTFVSYDLYHKYSKSLHYPRTIMFANNLEKGKHTLELIMSKKSSSKGNAMRIMNFVVN
jgi:lysophospholipase L1-like esterase